MCVHCVSVPCKCVCVCGSTEGRGVFVWLLSSNRDVIKEYQITDGKMNRESGNAINVRICNCPALYYKDPITQLETA